MSISMARFKRVGSTTSKIVTGLAVISAIGAIYVGPALGQHNQKRQVQHHQVYRHPGYRPYGYLPYGYQPYQPYVYPSYSYFVPVPPPPVVYVPPPPSLGINLFFPIGLSRGPGTLPMTFSVWSLPRSRGDACRSELPRPIGARFTPDTPRFGTSATIELRWSIPATSCRRSPGCST